MNWKPPKIEAEWDECLSAYMDGELDAEVAAALEAHLEVDVRRAQQLEALKQTSAMLQSWTVDAPAPSRELQAVLTNPAQARSKPTRIHLSGFLRLAAAFAMGVLAGGWVMRPGDSAKLMAPQAQVLQPPVADPARFTVSQDRADAVFKEVEAAALTQRIQQDARQGRWKNAIQGLERMETQYAETEAAVTFTKNPMARRILWRSFQGRS
jgi:anti-sigma factor RsiW